MSQSLLRSAFVTPGSSPILLTSVSKILKDFRLLSDPTTEPEGRLGSVFPSDRVRGRERCTDVVDEQE